MRKIRHSDHVIEIDSYRIPVKIYQERRNSVRVAIGKDHAILRIPLVSFSSLEKNLGFLEEWLTRKVLTQKRYQRLFSPKDFTKPYELAICDEVFIVQCVPANLKQLRGKIENNKILIRHPQAINPNDQQKSIKQLISRLCAKHFKNHIENRVDYWNDQIYKEEIKGIRLKYNSSNWGSCSSKGNLNFSTRLLFAPFEVRDYVIIHELAHLKELNHSKKFWNWVELAMPNYLHQEKWLKVHGYLCDF